MNLPRRSPNAPPQIDKPLLSDFITGKEAMDKQYESEA
jgi:hypothetical protein